MTRVILVNLFLLLLPFLLFVIYAWITNRGARKGSLLADAPLATLSLVGVVLVIGMVGYFITYDATPPGGKYTPPSFRDGQLQPSHIDR